MQKMLALKAAMVVALSLFIVVVIGFVADVVGERQQRQNEAITEISESYSGAQRTASPILIIPYVEEWQVPQFDDKKRALKPETRRKAHVLTYFPTSATVDAGATTDWKHRGLFRALVYEWKADEMAQFSVPATLPYQRDEADSVIVEGIPSIILPLTDPRGLIGQPEASFGGHMLTFERAGGVAALDRSIHASIPLRWLATGEQQVFQMHLGLRGTDSFAFVPYGDATHLALRSAWPNPSFGGTFLPSPQATHIASTGFDATWDISGLASSATGDMENCIHTDVCMGFEKEQAIDVRFLEPINIYTLSNRAIKYRSLFVGLVFAAFFLFELVKRLRIHPAQYLLVGLAIALFFQLLISVSEHLAFWLAYLIAAVASTALISVYLSGILRSARRGAGFGAGMALLYAFLYGVLSSEDNALVLGSVLLFLVLGMAMLITLKLDWYNLPGQPLKGDVSA